MKYKEVITKNLKKGDVVLSYEAKFKILEDAKCFKSHTWICGGYEELAEEFKGYWCPCKCIHNPTNNILLEKYDVIQSSALTVFKVEIKEN